MSSRSILSCLLVLWLILSIARLLFDLIGKLWIAAIFDLLQIVCCITGLFGSLQKRKCLLFALSISNIISILQNILIFLWYIGIFGEISRPVLSAGLPYSFSFFLRFTPGCQSHFDLKRTIWVQHSCLIPYYIIEASQAILHIILSISTMILAILVIFEIRSKSKSEPNQAINHYAQINMQKNGTSSNSHVGINPSMNDSSSGYVNSTYDEQQYARKREVIGQYERNSKRKKGKKSRPNSMPAPDCQPCSSKSSEEENIEDVYTKPIKKKSSTGTINDPQLNDLEDPSQKSTNLTSLVSFDPKSATLLRIRQHLEAESDDRETPESGMESDGIYERLRSRSSGISSDLIGPSSSTIQLSEYKSRNASQDSVPSIFAPMLIPNTSVINKTSCGIKLSSTNTGITSPGIRLSDQLGSTKINGGYKSVFRVQSKDSNRIIGHYHSPNEIPLSSDPKSSETNDPSQSNYPVITSNGLLV